MAVGSKKLVAIAMLATFISSAITASYASGNSRKSGNEDSSADNVKSTLFFVSAIISSIVTGLSILSFLCNSESVKVRQQIAFWLGLFGILIFITCVVFSVSVTTWWSQDLNKGERVAACVFGFLTSILHFGVSFLTSTVTVDYSGVGQ